MSTLRAYLGVAGLGDVGYRLYNRNTALTARSTTDVIDEGDGWFSAGGVDLTLAGLDNVRWDSTSRPDLLEREQLTIRIATEAIQTALAAAYQIFIAKLYTPVPGPVEIVSSAPVIIPTGTPTGHLSVAAKLRWLPKKPGELMTIKNFEALRLMMQAIMMEKMEKLNEAEALQAKAVKTLEEELREYLSGQQIELPSISTFGLNDLGGVR